MVFPKNVQTPQEMSEELAADWTVTSAARDAVFHLPDSNSSACPRNGPTHIRLVGYPFAINNAIVLASFSTLLLSSFIRRSKNEARTAEVEEKHYCVTSR